MIKKKYLALLSTVIQQTEGGLYPMGEGAYKRMYWFFGFHVDGPMTGGAYKRGDL